MHASPAAARNAAREIRKQVAELRRDKKAAMVEIATSCTLTRTRTGNAMRALRKAAAELVKARKAELVTQRKAACDKTPKAKRAKAAAVKKAEEALAQAETAAAVIAGEAAAAGLPAAVEAALIEAEAPALVPIWRELAPAITPDQAATVPDAVELIVEYAKINPADVAAAIERSGEAIAEELEPPPPAGGELAEPWVPGSVVEALLRVAKGAMADYLRPIGPGLSYATPRDVQKSAVQRVQPGAAIAGVNYENLVNLAYQEFVKENSFSLALDTIEGQELIAWTGPSAKREQLVRLFTHAEWGPIYQAMKGIKPPKAPRGRTKGKSPEVPPPPASPPSPVEAPPSVAENEALALLGVKLQPLPREAVLAAYRNTSHTPEKRADSTEERYRAELESFAADLVSSASADELPALREEFRKFVDGYRSRIVAALAADSKTASAMIVGPSKFPTERNRKALRTAEKRWEELRAYRDSARRRLIKQASGSTAISSDDPDAPDALREKLADLEERDREEIEEIKRVASDKKLSPAERKRRLLELGLPDFQAEAGAARGWAPLQFMRSNLRQEIARVKERIELLEKKRSESTSEVTVPFEGKPVRVVDDVEANRLQIFFDGKPSPSTIARLKERGFKWAPSSGAWQRFRSEQAKDQAGAILGASMDALGTAPPAPPPVVEVPAPAAPRAAPSSAQVELAREAIERALAGGPVEHGALHRRVDPAASHEATDRALELLEAARLVEQLDQGGQTFYRRTTPGRPAEGFRPAATPGQTGALFEEVEPAPLPLALVPFALPARWHGDFVAGYLMAPGLVSLMDGVLPVPQGSEAAAFFEKVEDPSPEAEASGVELMQVGPGLGDVEERANLLLEEATAFNLDPADNDAPLNPAFTVLLVTQDQADKSAFAEGAIIGEAVFGADLLATLEQEDFYFAHPLLRRPQNERAQGILTEDQRLLAKAYGLGLYQGGALPSKARIKARLETEAMDEAEQGEAHGIPYVLAGGRPLVNVVNSERGRVQGTIHGRSIHVLTADKLTVFPFADELQPFASILVDALVRTWAAYLDRDKDPGKDLLSFLTMAAGTANERIARREPRGKVFVGAARGPSLIALEVLDRVETLALVREGRGKFNITALQAGSTYVRFEANQKQAADIFKEFVRSLYDYLLSGRAWEDRDTGLFREALRAEGGWGSSFYERLKRLKERTPNPDDSGRARCQAAREEIRALELDQRALLARLLEIKRHELTEARVAACDAPRVATRKKYDGQIDKLLRQARELEQSAKDMERTALPPLSKDTSDGLIEATLGAVEPRLVPLWRELAKSIQAPTASGRLEAFLAYARDNERDAQRAQQTDPTTAELPPVQLDDAPPAAPPAPAAPRAYTVPGLDPRVVETKSGKLAVISPYEPGWIKAAKGLGGSFGKVDDQKAWLFDKRDKARVLAALVEEYGTSGEPVERVDLEVRPAAYEGTGKAELWLWGRQVLSRPGRDRSVYLGTGVTHLSGPRWKGRGGSMKYPEIDSASDTWILVRDVPRSMVSDAVLEGKDEDARPHRTENPSGGVDPEDVVLSAALVARLLGLSQAQAKATGPRFASFFSDYLDRRTGGAGLRVLWASRGPEQLSDEANAREVARTLDDAVRAWRSQDPDEWSELDDASSNPSGGRGGAERARVWIEDRKVKVAAPFSLPFQRRALQLGGRWNASARHWFFPESEGPAVRAAVREVYEQRTTNPCGCGAQGRLA